MIKRFFSVFLLLTAIGHPLWAQQNIYYDIIKGLAIDVEKGTADRISIPDGEKESLTISNIISILNRDVFAYYELGAKYKTELQQESFKKTSEYAEYIEYINHDRDEILSNKYYVFYNLRYNNNYDVKKKAFVFSIGQYDWQRTHTKGYITLGKKKICVSFPAKRTKITSRRDYYNELYVEQQITIPFNNDEAAIQIEKAMNDPYCETYLVFEVSFVKSVTENNREIIIPQTFLLTKTSGLYIINKKTQTAYNVSSALK